MTTPDRPELALSRAICETWLTYFRSNPGPRLYGAVWLAKQALAAHDLRDLLAAKEAEMAAYDAELKEARQSATYYRERAETAERQLAEEREHRKRLSDELFDLRNRCGCGPEQSGPDIFAELAHVTAEHRAAVEVIADLEDKLDAAGAEIERRVAEEREACLVLARDSYADSGWHPFLKQAAADIASKIEARAASLPAQEQAEGNDAQN